MRKLEAYNMSLSTIDQSYIAVVDAEKVIAEWTERMLLNVAGKYGKNRDEYKMAGARGGVSVSVRNGKTFKGAKHLWHRL